MKFAASRTKVPLLVKAAIWGAVIFPALTGILVICCNFFGRGSSGTFQVDFCMLVGWLLILPSIYLSEAIGTHSILINPYTVNGVLGAIVFVVAVSLWKFLTTNNEIEK
jgi:hypothetical protein